jgi:hypothetical protein
MRGLVRQRGTQHREQGSAQQAALRQLRQALDKTGVGHEDSFVGQAVCERNFLFGLHFEALSMPNHPC